MQQGERGVRRLQARAGVGFGGARRREARLGVLPGAGGERVELRQLAGARPPLPEQRGERLLLRRDLSGDLGEPALRVLLAPLGLAGALVGGGPATYGVGGVAGGGADDGERGLRAGHRFAGLRGLLGQRRGGQLARRERAGRRARLVERQCPVAVEPGGVLFEAGGGGVGPAGGLGGAAARGRRGTAQVVGALLLLQQHRLTARQWAGLERRDLRGRLLERLGGLVAGRGSV